jgi:hypothetical protein
MACAQKRAKFGLVYDRHFKHALRLVELAVRRAYGNPRRLLWLLLVGWPRRIKGNVNLFYHRPFKYALGLVELTVRLRMASPDVSYGFC